MASGPHDRDERFAMHGADPEAVLRALLQVDPDADPVDDDEPAGGTADRFGPRQQWGPRGQDRSSGSGDQ